MSPLDHYVEAERILREIDVPNPSDPLDHIRELRVAMAQAHATLALVPHDAWLKR